jgi:D-tyrosyl-tRNA(Tyr) deacylase
MRLLLQRVRRAEVRVGGEGVGAIGEGLLVLAGFGREDGPELPGSRVWNALVEKTLDLRLFPGEGPGAERMDRSLRDTRGGLLLVSQFTLYADTRRGRRPSFSNAAPPEAALVLYGRLAADLAAACPGPFAQGVFGADMALDFVNWGPVTILLDSADYA